MWVGSSGIHCLWAFLLAARRYYEGKLLKRQMPVRLARLGRTQGEEFFVALRHFVPAQGRPKELLDHTIYPACSTSLLQAGPDRPRIIG